MEIELMLLLVFTFVPAVNGVYYEKGMRFVHRVKERFQGDNRHVYRSFLGILNTFLEGTKTANEVYHEIIALLQGHDDLIIELSNFLNR